MQAAFVGVVAQEVVVKIEGGRAPALSFQAEPGGQLVRQGIRPDGGFP